jgi:glycine hydroxymethyltransferase
MVPFDDKSPFVTSGMRVGTAAMTTRGLKENDMSQIVDMVDKALMNHDNESVLKQIKGEVNEWVKQFPLYL